MHKSGAILYKMTKEEIKTSIEKNELQLKFWGKVTHYGIVFGILIIPLTITFIKIANLISGKQKHFVKNEMLFILIPFLISIFFYFIQKRRLQFKVVETKLSVEKIKSTINEVAEELKWIKNKSNEYHYVATTSPGFFSGSWGELITIIFDKNRVYINSICNPNEKSSVVSMGRNRKNVNTLVNKINKESH